MQLKPHPLQHVYQRIGKGIRTVQTRQERPSRLSKRTLHSTYQLGSGKKYLNQLSNPLPFMVVWSGAHSPTNKSQNGTNTQLRLCMQNLTKIYLMYNANRNQCMQSRMRTIPTSSQHPEKKVLIKTCYGCRGSIE